MARTLAGVFCEYRAGVPFNLDFRDGYPSARERLYAAFQRAGTRPIALARDGHAACWSSH
ncbi:hypothetical protein ACMGDM_18910 [Sphingomonas sp. DT-51]|uniref:hypothetical protein n=1 Tax=Sphingomonas sp. DT-51 TaxID=3396165 RepID=UPI003F1DF8E3